MKGLGQLSLGAMAWGTAGSAVRMLLQIAAQVVLARILGPEQYGIFAIGAVIIGFSNFVSDAGLAYGLIQKTHVDERDLRFVFTWQLILGLLVAGGLVLASAPLAGFFGEPRAQPVIAALALVCLFNALAAPALNLLKRGFDYRSIQLANVSSYFVGFYVVGIPLALAGSQVWALALAWLVQALLFLLLVYGRSRHAVGWLPWYEQAPQQMRYAASVLATNLLNWLVTHIDRVIVGRVFGAHEIGLYATAFNLVNAPGSAAAGVLQPVFLSAASRLAQEPERVAAGYRGLFAAVVALALPAFAVLAVLSDSLVLALFGAAWTQAAPLLAPLALAMPMFLLLAISTPVLWTHDRISREFRLQLPLLVLWVAVCAAAASVSLLAVAWAVLGLYCLRAAVMVLAASRAVQVGAGPLWRASWGGLLLTLAAAAAAWGTALAVAELPPLARVLTAALAATLCWLLLARVLPATLCAELRDLIARVLPRLPAAARNALSYLGPRGA